MTTWMHGGSACPSLIRPGPHTFIELSSGADLLGVTCSSCGETIIWGPLRPVGYMGQIDEDGVIH